ncbi:MAG TPA: metallopeptidase family protein [Phycisphaerales bacterium]|nr:metallopeptidase family protein [Phycisphaerales bacterium]
MTPAEQEKFDALVEEVIENLPEGVRKLLDEVPVIVEDKPSRELIEQLREEGVMAPDELEDDSSLCGLHTGTAFTERRIDDTGQLPSDIYLFREGILAQAGGWKGDETEEDVYEEIWVTLLHEIGHQFGLSEEDLEKLGYE